MVVSAKDGCASRITRLTGKSTSFEYPAFHYKMDIALFSICIRSTFSTITDSNRHCTISNTVNHTSTR